MEKDIYLFAGCIGLVFANSVLFFMPQLLLLGLTALQGGMIINEFLDSKWKMLFINLGISNAEKKTPQLISKEKNDLGDRYIFSVPVGLCLSDFEKMHEELELALQKPIKLELTNNYKLAMQVSDVEFKEVYKPNKGVYLDE
jgi:hypothetical protein